MTVSRVYTPEEDELIKAARLEELEGLADRLGRKRYNILNRRTRLLRGDDLKADFHRPSPQPRPSVLVENRLARPTWFDDAEVLHTRLRSGR